MRIVNENLINQVHRILKPQGILHIAAYLKDYALNIIEYGKQFNGFGCWKKPGTKSCGRNN